jgi:hypothetical protein
MRRPAKETECFRTHASFLKALKRLFGCTQGARTSATKRTDQARGGGGSGDDGRSVRIERSFGTALGVDTGAVGRGEVGRSPATLKRAFRMAGTLVVALCNTHTFEPPAVL